MAHQINRPVNLGSSIYRPLDPKSANNQKLSNIKPFKKSELPAAFRELFIRFDSDPNFYQKEDFIHLCRLLVGGLADLYQLSGNTSGEFPKVALVDTDDHGNLIDQDGNTVTDLEKHLDTPDDTSFYKQDDKYATVQKTKRYVDNSLAWNKILK